MTDYAFERNKKWKARTNTCYEVALLLFPLPLENGAEEKTRTSTRLPSHEPESCASTNSATSAYYFQMVTEVSLSLLTLAKSFNDICS